LLREKENTTCDKHGKGYEQRDYAGHGHFQTLGEVICEIAEGDDDPGESKANPGSVTAAEVLFAGHSPLRATFRCRDSSAQPVVLVVSGTNFMATPFRQ
jgi:hypothetical protein